MGKIVFLIVISLLPFLYLFTQMRIVGNFTYAFGNIAGLIGAVLLLWEFILGIKEIAKKMKTQKIQEIIFDRGPYRYHGRVKTVADSLREEGIKF
jgi:hypothetical protein